MRLLVMLVLAFSVGLNSHAAADNWGMSTSTTSNGQSHTTTQTPTPTTSTPTSTMTSNNHGGSEAATNPQNNSTPTATSYYDTAATVSPGNATSIDSERSSSSSANTVSTSSSTSFSSGSVSMVLGLVGVMGAVLAVSMFINARIRKKREQRVSDEAKRPLPGQSAQHEPYSGLLSPSRMVDQQPSNSSNSMTPQHEVIDIQQQPQQQETVPPPPSAFISAPSAAFVDATFIDAPTPNIHAPAISQTPVPEFVQLFSTPVSRVAPAPVVTLALASQVQNMISSAPEFDDFERGSGSNEVIL